MFSRWKNFFVVLIMALILTAGVSFALQDNIYKNNVLPVPNTSATLSVATGALSVPQKLSNPPEIIKAVYVTGYSAGNKKYLNYLNDLFKNTEINAVVVDIKGSDGVITYPTLVSDINVLVKFFHDKNIYVIGRIVIFEDPVYSKARPELAIYDKIKTALWKDNKGLSWLDPVSKEVWDYNVSLAKDAFLHGFDEINFDYVRFPSDGKVENMGFPFYDGKTAKSEIIKEFFNYLRQKLSGEKLSVDIFGQTTVNTDDMGIGQIIEDSFENFDYVSPMVYPSHYINGFIGFDNPAEHPYEVIKYSLDSAVKRKGNSLAKLRPWLQDFNMGADYTADMVKQEIKATQDALGDGFNGFMLWNPSNIYTTQAILK